MINVTVEVPGEDSRHIVVTNAKNDMHARYLAFMFVYSKWKNPPITTPPNESQLLEFTSICRNVGVVDANELQDLMQDIPNGNYCYNATGIEYKEDGRPVLKKKQCHHWKKTEKGARCNLIGEEHHEHCPFHLVWDSVKMCNTKKYDGEKTCTCG